MATINIGGRTVEVPDNLDLPGNSAPSLRNNVFGDAAAQTANPRTITPQITPEPIGQNPGMTGNPANNELLRAAQQRIDPVQTAARNAAWPQTPQLRGDGPSRPWSQFESEVRARGNPWAGKPEFVGPEPMRGGVSTAPTAPTVAPPTLRERAAGAARTAGGFAIGAAAAYGGNKLAEAMSNAGNPGRATPGAPTIMGSQAASQIPTDGYPKAPPAQPYNFWTDNEAGRNLGNAVQAVAPLGGLAAATKAPGMATRVAGLADAALVGMATGVNEQRQQAAPPLTNGSPLARSTVPIPTRASTQPITFAPTDGPEQPSGARTNVLRIGNSYSGPEGVGGNISINNVGHRGTVTMMGGQPGDATPAERLAQIERDTLHAREMNGLRAQLMDRGAPLPGVTMFSGETLGSALRKQSDAQGSLSTINNSDIGAKDRALLAQNERNQNLQAATTRRGQDMLADTTWHGQNLTYAGQTRGQDIVASTALRGQDMDLQGRVLPKQMEIQMAQQMRRIHGDLMKASGGDYGKAAQLASAYGLGDHAKNFMELGQAEQKFGSEKLNAVRDMFKGQFASPDKDGKLVRDELLESQAAAMALAANPNFASMPQDQRNELVGNIGRQVKQLQSANAKNGDIWSWMKLKNAPSAYTSMPSPEELRGATYGDAGWGAILPGGANRLDRQLRLKDGREFNIDPSLVTQGDIALWEKYGAKPR